MGRERRVVGAGLRFHAMGHAVEGELLFRDEQDRWEFIRRTARVAEEENAIIEAHSEMPNHFHLGILTASTPISDVMQRIESGYSHYYNVKYGRKGHLFRDRFLSKVLASADYRLAALQYIHLNPLKAGIVRSLDELEHYPFTGHAALMGNGLPWIQDLSVLKLFGDRIPDARRELRRQMAATLDLIPDDESSWFTEQVAVGRGEAEKRAAEDARITVVRATTEHLRRRRDARTLRLDWPLEDLVREIAHRCGVLRRDVVGPRRADGASDARAVICHLATRMLGYAPSHVAEILAISPAAVCQASQRGSALVRARRAAFPEFRIPRKPRSVA